MIDFKSNTVFKLSPSTVKEDKYLVEPMLIDGKEVFATFKTGCFH